MAQPVPTWSTLRSFKQDGSVRAAQLPPGTVRRIARFAGPYRRWIGAFLVLVVLDATLVVATPLLVRRLVDDGVVPGDRSVVSTLALVIAGLAVVDALFALAQRWYSARIG